MKKVLLLLTCAIWGVACSDQEVLNIEPKLSPQLRSVSTNRSYEEAFEIAQKSITILNNRNNTRAISRQIDTSDCPVITSSKKTRSAMMNDTLIYVFNFENNEGFALVSASKGTEGLLAITEKGHYMLGKESDNESFDYFIEKAKDYVMASKIPPIEPIDTTISINVVKEQIDNIVGPYISVKWGQNDPEGVYFSNGIAGCTNTAMAQIMSYYCWPNNINLTYNGSGSYDLDWIAMNKHNNFSSLENECNGRTTHTMVAKLCRQLGFLNSSQCFDYFTNTQTERVGRSTLVTLGYNVGNWTSYTQSYVKRQLDQNHLLLMIGQLHQSEAGHAWVVDGYRIIGPIEYVYKKIGNGDWFIDEIYDKTTYYNHINWGFYGDNDGYFVGGIFAMSDYSFPDTGNNPGNYNFDWGLKVLSVYK